MSVSARDPDTDGALTADEAARLQRMTSMEARRLRRAAWIFRREVVAAHLRADPLSLRFAPRVPVAGGAHVSLSHANGAIAVALDAAPVGVDIEPVAGRGDPCRLATRFFGADEAAANARAPDPATAFVWRWTAKEALMKATGVTLRAALTTDVGPDGPLPIERAVGGVFLTIFAPAPGFVCAIARQA